MSRSLVEGEMIKFETLAMEVTSLGFVEAGSRAGRISVGIIEGREHYVHVS